MKPMMKTLIAAFAGVLLSFGVLANPFEDQTGWELEKEKKGIKVWLKQEEGKKYMTYRATATFKSSRDKIMATLTDIDRMHEWSGKLKASKEVERLGEFEYVTWTEYDMPFIYDDRDFVMHGKGEQISETAFLILLESKPDGYPEQEGLVRVQDTSQAILIEEIDPTTYRVTQQVYLDPVDIPVGMANGRLAGEAIDFMRDLRDALEQ